MKMALLERRGPVMWGFRAPRRCRPARPSISAAPSPAARLRNLRRDQIICDGMRSCATPHGWLSIAQSDVSGSGPVSDEVEDAGSHQVVEPVASMWLNARPFYLPAERRVRPVSAALVAVILQILSLPLTLGSEQTPRLLINYLAYPVDWNGKTIMIGARLQSPLGIATKVPAVILLHGTGGVRYTGV